MNDELPALEKQLSDEHTALSTADCTTACRALASIKRAADRICALDSGARCEAARTKAADAAKRVTEACPDCQQAAGVPAPVTTEAAPPAEPPKAGGCASCAAAGTDTFDPSGLVLIAAWLFQRGRRRRARRRLRASGP